MSFFTYREEQLHAEDVAVVVTATGLSSTVWMFPTPLALLRIRNSPILAKTYDVLSISVGTT